MPANPAYHRNLLQVTGLRSIKPLWLRVHSFYAAMRRRFTP